MAKKPQILLVTDRAALGPQPPRPLGKVGQSLWHRVQSEADVSDAVGVEFLTLACEQLDLAEALQEQIARDGTVVRLRGSVKAHPALRDLTQARALVARLLARLGLDVEPTKAVGRPPSGLGWRGYADEP
jgi:phage terminase small subunit